MACVFFIYAVEGEDRQHAIPIPNVTIHGRLPDRVSLAIGWHRRLSVLSSSSRLRDPLMICHDL
jgi:hypothetical protein